MVDDIVTHEIHYHLNPNYCLWFFFGIYIRSLDDAIFGFAIAHLHLPNFTMHC